MRVGLFVNLAGGYREKIRHAKELGFDCGQLLTWDPGFYTDENCQGLKKVLEEEQFAAEAFWCGWTRIGGNYPDKFSLAGLVPDWMRQQRLEELYQGAEFAYKLGIDTICTHVGYFPEDPTAPAHLAIVQCLKMLGQDLALRGQKFTFEIGQETPLSLSILLQEIGLDNVGVNFDPANLITGGKGNPNDAMELLGCKVMGMHAKDALPPKYGEYGGKQVLIGEGRVDFKGLLSQLKELGYKGDIVIEQTVPGRPDPDADLLAAKAYLENLIAQVGI